MRIPEAPRNLIIDMLRYDPLRRPSLAEILSNPWFCESNPLIGNNLLCSHSQILFELIRSNQSTQLSCLTHELIQSNFALTQPEPIRLEFLKETDSLSQPDSSNSPQFCRDRFGRRTCIGSTFHNIRKIEGLLKSMLIPFKLSLESGMISFQTVDGRKCPLSGTITVQSLNDQCLVVIRKTKGNPLEYARFFKYLVDRIND